SWIWTKFASPSTDILWKRTKRNIPGSEFWQIFLRITLSFIHRTCRKCYTDYFMLWLWGSSSWDAEIQEQGANARSWSAGTIMYISWTWNNPRRIHLPWFGNG